jgi:hypothetical protein
MYLAAMQPHFFPWCGYMALLDYVDEFIILDDVQFDKRSWQQRNNINLHDKNFKLTIPVKSKKKSTQKINEAEIDYSLNFIQKHKKNLEFAYKKFPYFEKYYNEICEIYDKNHRFIIDLNLEFINYFIKKLNINTKLILKSNLNINSKKENMIIDICNLRQCENYISTHGSKEYLKLIDKKKIVFNIFLYDFECKTYYNNKEKFLTHLSFVDLLFYKGENSIEYLRDNFRFKKL